MRYRLFYWWVKIAVRIFFKNIQVVGKEHIPKNTPVIFALNHQNTLLDALVMAVSVNEPVHFMTRADIFKKQKIARFLRSINLIPIYRIRDGYSALSQNEEVINHCIDLLRQNKHILIFPEGSHNYQRHLRPLKKGIARIAVDAALKNEAEVLIIPVGINYGSHKHSRSWLHIQIGNPISVEQSLSLFDNHRAKAENDLMVKIEVGLKNQMVHFEDVSNYRDVNDIAKLVLQHSNCAPKDFFDKHREIVKNINSKSEAEIVPYLAKVADYRVLLEKHKIKRNMMGKASMKASPLLSLFSLLLLPFVFLGELIFFPPLWCYQQLIKKFKDKHWEASIKVVSIMVVYPFWIILLLVVCALFTPNLILLLFFKGVLLVLAVLIVLLKNQVELALFIIKMKWMKRKNPKDYTVIINLEIMLGETFG
jgi:1-acyl-sn-glycerol-3-phosphate acyltransferase